MMQAEVVVTGRDLCGSGSAETIAGVMVKGTFDQAPLADLLPDATAADLERMRSIAGELDRARPDRPLWHWCVDHAIQPSADNEYLLGILLTSIVLDNVGSDWLELELEIEWLPGGPRRVYAAANVACWCDTDHISHYLSSRSIEIAGDVSIGAAFEKAAAPMLDWIARPRDPSEWRDRFGLPQPPAVPPHRL